MPRIRSIHPDFFRDDDLAKLPPMARLLYAGLWVYADRDGRIEYNPTRLKADIFPYDLEYDFISGITLLAQKKPSNGSPFIIFYPCNDHWYVQISTWGKWQHPHATERKSSIPAPTKEQLSQWLKAYAQLFNRSLTVK
jgi:hypothetical protein